MAADMAEMEELAGENIRVRTLVTPIRVTTEGGRVTSVSFIRNMLSKVTTSGKPQISPVADSEFEVPCDHLIAAIGQLQDWSLLPEGVESKGDGATSHPQIFTAGDYLTGSKDIIHAIDSGKQAAFRIDEALMGRKRLETIVEIALIDNDGETGRFRDHDLQLPIPMPTVSVLDRSPGDTEVETGYDEPSSGVNALRCYFCHYKFEIDQDKCIHCNWCIEVAPRDCIHMVSRIFTDADGAVTDYVTTTRARDAAYVFIDSDKCIRCGNCLRVCPTEAISMRRGALKTIPCSLPSP
jgi:formate dehydrogenase major subunit